MNQALTKLRAVIGPEEVCALIGLPLTWAGLHEIYRPLAPLAIGVLLLAVAAHRSGFFRKQRGPE